MHVVITGATGFVGAALVGRLRAAGHQVTALVRPGTAAPAGCTTLEHALGSGGRLALPAGAEAVIHLAQSRAYRAFPADAREMLAVNVAGALELLEAAAAAKVAAFCLVSTGTVYEPYATPLVEDAALAPTSFLGASKLAAEVIARPFASLYPISVLRLFAPYGPGQAGRLVPELVRRVRAGEPVTLPARGSGMGFTPTHVDDVCDVIAAAVGERWSGTWNVAAPGVETIETAALAIGAALGREARFERGPAGPAPALVPDLSRLAARYDLARLRPFREGIRCSIAHGL